MNKPLVSIITPAFNASETIVETYHSIKKQSLPEWEWIIVNNCSIGNTKDIVLDLYKEDERIVLIDAPKNGGAAVARNIGIEAAKGRFIAFLDADDLWLPEKLERQLKFMEDNDYSFTYTDYYIFFPDVPYVENGVDLSRIVDCNKPLESRPYDVVVIGRFSYQKNHEFLIRTFAEIKKLKPDFKASFIGGGELFEQMKELAKKSNADFIEFLGTMTNPGVVLKDSKIIALGSRLEANPLYLLEGMAAGCIVVSSDVGGVKNIIKCDNGFLFKLDDDARFISIITEILSNVKKYNLISENNKVYSKKFSMENCVQNYIEVFKQTGF